MIKEDLIYSDYRLFEIRDSQIDKGSVFEVEIGLKCPHCKNTMETIRCEKSSDCNRCGLHLVRHGNRLSCTMAWNTKGIVTLVGHKLLLFTLKSGADYVWNATRRSIAERTQSLAVGQKGQTDQDTMEEKGNADYVDENLCSKLGNTPPWIGVRNAETKQSIRILRPTKQ